MYKRRVDGLPFIKIFLLFTFLWLSDESQKLFGFLIFLPFLEILNYLSHFYSSKINENIKKTRNIIEVNSEEISYSIRDMNDKKNKDKDIPNINIYYIIFFIIIQDMFIMANQNAFALMKNSFGLEIDKVQQSKVLHILTFLGAIFGNLSFYRFSFIIIGFYLEKEIYDKNEIIQSFSLDFIIRKILLNIRIDIDIIFLFYQILININDTFFVDLLMHFCVNFSLFIFGYIGFGLTILFRKIFP